MLALLMLVLLPAGSGAGPYEAPGPGGFCSIVPLPDARAPSLTYLLGSAAPDTVAAGAGTVETSTGPGLRSTGNPRTIHGQVVEVRRFGGADSARIARAFEANDRREVVIVPWDYDPACRPAPWRGSARWSPVGQEGTYTVTPRPVEHWVGGRPTFDAFMAGLEPYPHGVFFRGGRRGTDRLRSEPSLTAEEFFEFHRALPTADEARRDPAAAREALARWERQNPAIRERYPAPQILRGVRWMIERAR